MPKKGFVDSKRGCTNTDDAERSGRPNSAVIPETMEKVHKIVLADRKLKLREIADTLKISEGSLFTILHENLSMRKLCSKWVPRLLTLDQKQQRNQIDSQLSGQQRVENRPKRQKMRVSAGKVLASIF